jgi:hypothetical protein
MNRFITCTAVAVLLGLTPALAADNENNMQSQSGASQSAANLPTQSGVSPGAAQKATQPSSGSADTSGGAMDRSSAPPNSGAASAGTSADVSSGDQSRGAKEQSSAPAGSSAADTSKPNPTIGQENAPSSTSKE